MKTIFKDKTFNFEFIRSIQSAVYKGADINECLRTASRIKEGDFESWYTEWYRTAEKIAEWGDDSLSNGHIISARESYLRASGYFRASEFFIHGNPEDPRIVDISKKSRKYFIKAGKLFKPEFECLEIPYENTTLPGYFFNADESDDPRPTVIINQGFDGTAEENYAGAGAAALDRGYNVLSFEGPGQGRVIREQKILFRPDWENVIGPVVDHIISKPEVDPEKIVLYGLSMGGYFAPRAAAYEPRIAVCIANGGVYDFLGSLASNGNMTKDDMIKSAREHASIIDFIIKFQMKFKTQMRWAMQDGMWKFGAETPHDFMLKAADYTLENCVDKIKCPVLVVDGENEESFPGQSKILFDALKSPKDFILFTKEDAAESHCQVGAALRSSQRIFDWLDEKLGK